MRADKFFALKFGSRTKAAIALKNGLILKCGKVLSPDSEIEEREHYTILEQTENYVSQGGFKLARGLDFFCTDVSGQVFLDLGSSTGGFCDCLLKRGASKVYCVDVGENQLDESLRKSPRVTVMDRTNARYLTRECFQEPLDGITGDLSFISLRLILPVVYDLLPENGRAFLLFKPQFECEGKGLTKNGILPRGKHKPLLERFYGDACSLGLSPQGIVNAPLRERKNTEYVVFLKKGASPIKKEEFLNCALHLYEEKI